MAQGMREQSEKRGVKVVLYLEYESGNRDFGAIAARVKEANADFLWVGSLGLESNQVLEALRKLDYTPKNHFHLYPAPAAGAVARRHNALCSTFLEPDEPFMSRPGMKRIARPTRSGDQGEPALRHHRCAGRRHGRGMADPRGRRERRQEPRGQADRGLAEEEHASTRSTARSLRRAVTITATPRSSSSRCRTSEWKVVWPTVARRDKLCAERSPASSAQRGGACAPVMTRRATPMLR
jgi:hypothetical protein